MFNYIKKGLTCIFLLAKVIYVNKKTAVLAALASTILLISPVLAKDSTTSSTIRKEAVQQRIETKREIAQTRIENIREKMASREALLKSKLDGFRDRKKATAAARINTNLNNINAKQTEMMQKHLDVMTAILNKLENRVNEGKPDIKDSTAAKTAIANARSAISSASAAVTAQSQNDYTIQVTTESKVRLDALSQREQLYKDIMALRKLIIETKRSVINAIRVARAEKPETEKEATESGN